MKVSRQWQWQRLSFVVIGLALLVFATFLLWNVSFSEYRRLPSTNLRMKFIAEHIATEVRIYTIV